MLPQHLKKELKGRYLGCLNCRKNVIISVDFEHQKMSSNLLNQFIESDAEKLSGTPVFRGTRVPVKNLFDYLEAGDNLEEFLDDFPTVTRTQVVGVLELYKIKILQEYEVAA